jgi:hypothetical protein
MIIKSKVKPTDLCIVKFAPGQSINATCVGVKADIFGRIYFDCELILSQLLTDEAIEEAEKTIIEGIPEKCIRPMPTCSCDPTLYSDVYVHSRQVVINMPDWFDDHEIRIKNKMPTTICIDQCIVEKVKGLWEKAIETTGCCCGHNVMRPWVSVTANNYISMLELGYEQMQVEVVKGHAMGLYTFYL